MRHFTVECAEFKKEDLSQKKPLPFSSTHAKLLETFIQHSMKKLKVPGAAIAIIQDNKIVFSKGFGFKQQGRYGYVTPDTLFMIGSTTKSLTSLMISKLVELGKLSWETPVVKVLPQFKLADKDITPKILMHHTMSASTGMPRRDTEILFEAKDVTGDIALQQIAIMKPTTALGETFQYSNHLVAIGGFAAANAYKDTGDLFDKYNDAMNELIFCPLGMDNTVVYPTEKSKLLMAVPHAMDYRGNLVIIPTSIDDFAYTVAPAGSIWSNVHDMANYLLMELNNGRDISGKIIFSEEQILKRRTPGIKMRDESSYGLGLMTWQEKKLNFVGHGGNTMGFTSALFFLPDHNIGVVILTNSGGANAFTDAIKQRLLELLFDAESKSDKQVQFFVKLREDGQKIDKERISLKPKDTQWINEFVGEYKNHDLGLITIQKMGRKFEFVTSRWTSEIASYQEKNGDKLLSLISAPWQGGFKFQVWHAPEKKLIFDAGQVKYEFVPVVKEKICLAKNQDNNV